jgi:hypothetical protein
LNIVYISAFRRRRRRRRRRRTTLPGARFLFFFAT